MEVLPEGSCFRLIVENKRMVGAALGTIIAIIITHHMMKTMSAWSTAQGIGSISMPAMLISMPAPARR
jgi:hypothetical protein